MYEDTYKEYDPTTFYYGGYHVNNIVCPPPYAEWDYGDTFNLTFDLRNELKDVEDLDPFFVIFKIFNTRHEPVFEGCGDAERLITDYTFCFEVDAELSKKLIKGNYTCQLILKSSEVQCTLLSNYELHVR